MKQNSIFICSKCTKIYFKWTGYCSTCNSFDSLIEKNEIKENNTKNKNFTPPQLLSEINANNENSKIITSYFEFNRVLGGGIVENSVILLSGTPGIGKSTFLLNISNNISNKKKVLYISTEESILQIKLRANRLNIEKKDTNYENFLISQETSFEAICNLIENIKPDIVIIDSLQNIIFEECFLTNFIGKLKEVAHALVEHSRKYLYTLIITGHVTKDGTIAGPKALEHLVDVVLYFEGEENSDIRILQSSKNRFGSTDEIGFFIMTNEGIKEHPNPQNLLLENIKPTIGSALTWHSEGSRVFLIEIQSLLNKSKNPNVQRVINGIDHKQLILICAILEKYLKIPLYEFDIFCKIFGNIKVKNTNIDFALAYSLLSSYFNKITKDLSIFYGEISLSGNISSRKNIPKQLSLNAFGIKTIFSAEKKDKIFEDINYINIESIYSINKIFN